MTVEARTKYAKVIGDSEPAQLSWKYHKRMCFNFNSGLDYLQPVYVEKVENFRQIMRINRIRPCVKA